jgi:protein tyrosine phosphatase (PTP) superfamily phosphohydrolase (DUF442 family)
MIRSSRWGVTPLALTTLLLAGACTSDRPPADGETEQPTSAVTAATEATLQAATELGVRNARMPLPNLVTAGQPTEEQFDGLVDAGYEHFISLRLPNEDGAGWEEEHTAERPFHFERLPISGADALTRENVEALAELLDATGDEPTVLYCASSNRVGALLALKAYWVDGAEPDAAWELGKQAGLTRLEGPVRDLLGLDSGN